jgi:lipopolysaccharide transport system ATP-binding protein
VVPEYQRLLYAPPEAAARVRRQAQASGAAAAAREEETAAAAPDAPAQASLDPSLRSASVVEYAQHGARIGAPRITTPDGAAVNVLVRGDPYVVGYDVLFTAPARRVRFGMMIKTTTGVELGGGTWPPVGAHAETFAAGTRVRLAFAFRCRLFAGMYFLNVGLMGEVDGVDTYLHRMVDAVAFRVQPDPSLRPSGYVDLEVAASLHPSP